MTAATASSELASVDQKLVDQSNAPSLLGRIQIFPCVAFLICAAAAFWNTVDPSTDQENYVGVDWRVIFKVAIASAAMLCGGWGFLHSKKIRQSLLGLPGLLVAGLGVGLIVMSLFALAEVANFSRISALLHFGYVLFIPTALYVLGLRNVMIAILIGLVGHVALAWFLYIFFPDIGVFQEELAQSTFVKRMGGLGHPNGVGRNAVLMGLLSLVLYRGLDAKTRAPGVRAVLIMLMVLTIPSVLSTFSRTAMAAGMAATIFLVGDLLLTRRGIALCIFSLAIGISGLLAAQVVIGDRAITQSVLSAGTKTGDVSELTSATGRTAIWAATISLIIERPLTGYGLSSAPTLLENFSYRPHNSVLHITLAGGVFCGAAVLCLLAWNLFFGLTSSEPLIRAISMYVLISGLFEDTVVDTFASPITLLWLIVLLYPAIAMAFKLPIERIDSTAYNRPVAIA